jgi:protease-4
METNLPPNDSSAPPPLSTPPPIAPSRFAGSPQSSKKGRGWMVVALILLVLLGVSALLNVTHFVNSFTNVGYEHSSGPRLEEVTLEDNDAHDKIAVIRVDGVIAGADENGYDLVETIQAQLKRANDDKKVQAVVLKVNSPGGEVLASDEIYRLIADFQKDDGKPVVCSMGSLAASGGYYISAPCRWIVANELTITGSIGVIMHGFNYRGLMDKVGLRREVYKSGKFKDMLSPDRSDTEIPPEERAMVQNLIDETYGKFKSVVAEGRAAAHKLNGTNGVALAADWEQFADGRVVSGKEALRLGLVDELGNFDTAVEAALDFAGLDKANLVEYQPKHDLADLFRMFGKTDARALKVDLGVELPKVHAGYLYFLAPTFVR